MIEKTCHVCCRHLQNLPNSPSTPKVLFPVPQALDKASEEFPCESAESKMGPDLSDAGSGKACVKGCFRVPVLSHRLAGSKIL